MTKIRSIIQKMKSKFSSERGEIGDSFMTIIGIGTAVVLMVGVPLITMSQKTDDISTLSVETAVTEFVDRIRTTGKLSGDDYLKFEESLTATGNTYEIEMEATIMDENPGKKTTQTQHDKIGENVSYKMYTSQILDVILPSNNQKQTLALKEGDMIAVRVKNTNSTLYEQLSGNENPIVAQHGGIVSANGY